MPKPTWSTQVGIGKESTYGTGVTPTSFLPVTGLKADDKLTYVEDKGWRGAPVDVFAQYPGPAVSELSWDGPVFADTIGFLLAGVLGGDDVTGTAAPYSHVFTLNNTAQPKSYTLTDAAQGSMRQYAGVQMQEVSFKYDPQALFTYSAKAQGLLSTTLSTRPSASYSAVKGSLGWQFVPTIGGTAVQTVTSAEFSITRAQTPIYTLGQASAYAVYDGLVSASGKFTFVMEDESQLNMYMSGGTTTVNLAMTTGTGANQTGMNLQCSQVSYKTATKDRSKDYIELQVDWTALGNTTDAGSTGGYSPCKILVTNAVPSGTYM